MGSKCHRRLARQALAHIFIHVRKVPQKFGRRRRSRSRSCSSPTANSQTDRRRTGVIFSGRPPFLLLFFSPCFACVSIELSISRPCRGHSRPDPNKRDRNLIGPIRRRNEFPLEREEASPRTHLASRYHSLENAPPLLFWVSGSDNRKIRPGMM